jgi:hypothetical protein
MTFAEVDKLASRAMDFLISCGGPYEEIHPAVQRNLILAITIGWYVLIEKAGKIEAFASYLLIDDEDREKIVNDEIPEMNLDGSIIYVTDFGSRDRRATLRLTRQLHNRRKAHGITRIFYYRIARDRFKSFVKEITHG